MTGRLGPEERLALAQAVYAQTGHLPPKGARDLSSVTTPVERAVAELLAVRVEAVLAPIEALLDVTLEWYASDRPLISADQLRHALAAARAVAKAGA